MLSSIEELEIEIQEFQKNIASSGEIVKQLATLANLFKQNNEERERLEAILQTKLNQIPDEVGQKSFEALNSSIKLMDDKKNEMLESLSQMKQEFENSKKQLTEQYELFVTQMNSTNLNQITQKVSASQNSINTNIVLSIITLVSIISLLIVVLIVK